MNKETVNAEAVAKLQARADALKASIKAIKEENKALKAFCVVMQSNIMQQYER